jgi:1-acyl-sn-glycerol-3-phosphate acyltransferase
MRNIFFLFIVRPLVLLGLGLCVRNRDRLPSSGPAIIVANHNSHLDTMVLLSLFPLAILHQVRPVAAIDYFLKNRTLAWFATHIIGIIPLQRQVRKSAGNPLHACSQALEEGKILILFPEGSRGVPEQLSRFKTGIAHLAEQHPQIPIVPVFMHGLGKALPKGETLLVPFFCDIAIGIPCFWPNDRALFMTGLDHQFHDLSNLINIPEWD